MTEDEFLKNLEKVVETDVERADSLLKLWEEDPTRSWKQLNAIIDGDKSAPVRRPITEAFNTTEDKLRMLVDPNSDENWMTKPVGSYSNPKTGTLLRAAIDGGYVKELPNDAPEADKIEQRKDFGNFLRMLADETNLQGRRNAVRDFEKESQFTKNPLLWFAKGVVPTYTKRAKEQAMKGEGATSLSDMNAQDLGTLGLDLGAQTMLGAGSAGLSKALLLRGIGNAAKNYGLRSTYNVLGSDLAAGAIGGLASVGNRDLNTDEGARLYEYGTEPFLTGALNAIATPAVLRQGVRQGAHLIGLGAEKVGGLGKKKAFNVAQRRADEKYAEPALAATLRDLEEQAGRDLSNSIVKPETQAKIEDMYRIINDGTTRTAGKETSLLDDLQQLYDASAKGRYGVVGELMSNAGEGALPNVGRFSAALDSKIAQIENTLKTGDLTDASKGLLGRELEYYKTFRELMDNGLVDPEKYLNYADMPEQLVFKENNLVAAPGDNTPVFELGKKASKDDIELIKDYISNVNKGSNLVYDDGLMRRIELLKEKYPEFKRYVNSISTVPAYNAEEGMYRSVWPSLGRVDDPLIHFYDKPRASYEHYNNYGFIPNKSNVAAFVPNTVQILSDIAKPAAVQARLRAYDKPDNSLEALEAKYQEIRKNKPEAVDAAMEWKFDPRLESSKQLTMEERDVLDRYKEARRRAILGDD